MTYIWVIEQMNRLTSDGFVVNAAWRCNTTDGEFYATNYGTCGWTQQPGEQYIPYEDLTQEQVISWVQDTVGKDTIESGLNAQIEAQKNPVTANGLPWATA